MFPTISDDILCFNIRLNIRIPICVIIFIPTGDSVKFKIFFDHFYSKLDLIKTYT